MMKDLALITVTAFTGCNEWEKTAQLAILVKKERERNI